MSGEAAEACPHGIGTEGDADAAACAYYADPAHLATTGPAHKRQRPTKSAHVPVRFDPEMVAAIRRWSEEDGMTVSAWVRKLVRDEIARRDARNGGQLSERRPGR